MVEKEKIVEELKKFAKNNELVMRRTGEPILPKVGIVSQEEVDRANYQNDRELKAYEGGWDAHYTAERVLKGIESGNTQYNELLTGAQSKRLYNALKLANTRPGFIFRADPSSVPDNVVDDVQRYEGVGAKGNSERRRLLASINKILISSVEKAEGLERRRVYGGVSYVRKKAMASVIAFAGILGALFFLSFNITGNVIGSAAQSTVNWIGAALFIIGVIAAFFYFRTK